jgi:hypothetical protein
MTIGQLVKQVFALPQSIRAAMKQRRRRMESDKFEDERLDRIRNPAKYRGK